MPNWCNNTITIQGSTETLKTLWEEAQTAGSYTNDDGETVSQFGLLSAMVPEPKELAASEDDVMPAWYGWRVSNWGTKWDIGDDGLEFEDNGDGTASITGWFDSAWAPPIEALNTFADDMDGVSIELFYHEPGMCFVGYYSSEGGDDYYEYESRDDIPEYLMDHFGLEEWFDEMESDEETA